MKWVMLLLAALGPYVLIRSSVQEPFERSPAWAEIEPILTGATARPAHKKPFRPVVFDLIPGTAAPSGAAFAAPAVDLPLEAPVERKPSSERPMDDPRATLRPYDAAIARCPDVARLRVLRGMEAWRLRLEREAVSDVTEAKRRAPRLAIPLTEGLIAGWMTGWDEAESSDYYRDDLELRIDDLDAMIKRRPAYGWPLLLRAKLLFEEGDDRASARDFERYRALSWAAWSFRSSQKLRNAELGSRGRRLNDRNSRPNDRGENDSPAARPAGASPAAAVVERKFSFRLSRWKSLL